ncbi:MAG: gamma-glutamylcyclotransferase family protein [Pseudomonadota bacterium]|uniref:gamma-glutamylcyclotransferase family protein n=1 Tax=Roseovarius TaxID=74030 RepID=UPI0022A83287|nr:gamma-glutamylcyclotransferase family protein [Roseovarius sp. EGI FJ00037]MCZ0812413.1 gamma-glutamylcyclotransferase [Roseovarius sp. EGI FJ00037]
MSDTYFFGYGSLVNRDTHEFTETHSARLRGWRRIWRHTSLRPVAYLTVVPDPNTEIDGLIAPVPGHDWAALDERESAYDRVAAAHQISHTLPHMPEIAVYAIPEGRHSGATETHPALLSYIDVVVQGYLREFGETGAQRFFDTTDGWDAPVLDDRADPVYPRHRSLHPDERAFVDDQLRARDIRLLRR